VDNKISDLLDQKVEDRAHFLDSTPSLLQYEKLPSSLFLLAKIVSFYAKNILRILFLSNIYFVLIVSSFFIQILHFHNIISGIFTTLLILLLYICTFAHIVLEEENSIFLATKYAIISLIPTAYSCVIVVLTICGFAVFAFIPEFIILTFYPDSNTLKIIGGVAFAITIITIITWYSLFLFVALDESKYGFASLFRSKAYVEVNFPDYLRRLAVCIASVPVIFTLVVCLSKWFVVFFSVFKNLFDFTYDLSESVYHFRDWVENILGSYQIDIKSQYEMLGIWFIKIVLIIPFLITYLGFLYSTLNCKKPLLSNFSGSLMQRVILKFMLIIGTCMVLVLINRFL